MKPPQSWNLFSLEGRVALVTGAAGYIGAAIGACFAEAGAHVFLQCRKPSEGIQGLEAQLRSAGRRANVITGDIDTMTSAKQLIGRLLETRNQLDVLVNCAGSYPASPIMDMTEDSWREVFSSNLDAAFFTLQAAAASMRSRGAGAIINIASISAGTPAPEMAHYNASKAALLSLTRSAAQELGPAGIRVNAVSPGLIERPSLADEWPDGVSRWLARAPMGRLGSARDVANACLFLASDAAGWISGQELVVDGGISVAPAY